jgi:hypothetical protein
LLSGAALFAAPQGGVGGPGPVVAVTDCNQIGSVQDIYICPVTAGSIDYCECADGTIDMMAVPCAFTIPGGAGYKESLCSGG